MQPTISNLIDVQPRPNPAGGVTHAATEDGQQTAGRSGTKGFADTLQQESRTRDKADDATEGSSAGAGAESLISDDETAQPTQGSVGLNAPEEGNNLPEHGNKLPQGVGQIAAEEPLQGVVAGVNPAGAVPVTGQSPVNTQPVDSRRASLVNLSAAAARAETAGELITDSPATRTESLKQAQLLTTSAATANELPVKLAVETLGGSGPSAPSQTTALISEIAAANRTVIASGATPVADRSATTAIEIPISDSRWGAAVAQRAVVAIQQGLQRAEVVIRPAHLGPIEMQIQLQDDKASVTMISPHAAVRELLESATPRLRELLEQQGMTLEQNLVSDQPPGQSGFASSADSQHQPEESATQPGEQQQLPTVVRRSLGLIDSYV